MGMWEDGGSPGRLDEILRSAGSQSEVPILDGIRTAGAHAGGQEDSLMSSDQHRCIIKNATDVSVI